MKYVILPVYTWISCCLFSCSLWFFTVISSSLSLRTVFVMLSLQPPYTPLKLVSDDAFRAIQYTVGLHVGGKFYKMFQLENTNHDITHSHWKS